MKRFLTWVSAILFFTSELAMNLRSAQSSVRYYQEIGILTTETRVGWFLLFELIFSIGFVTFLTVLVFRWVRDWTNGGKG